MLAQATISISPSADPNVTGYVALLSFAPIRDHANVPEWIAAGQTQPIAKAVVDGGQQVQVSATAPDANGSLYVRVAAEAAGINAYSELSNEVVKEYDFRPDAPVILLVS
jgi:hypothetical protein